MAIVVLGVSYKKTPLDTRERLSVPKDNLPAALSTLSSVAQEAAILSTCNRTELYAVFSTAQEGHAALLGYASGYFGIPAGQLGSYAYFLEDSEAVRHIFTVTSGLDSMALGEYQIQGQVREAFDLAREQGSVGPVLSSLFRNALRVGKRIRAETGVGRDDPSLSDGALELAKKTMASLSNSEVLIIGAGKVSRLTAQKLREGGIARLFIASRTLESAEKLATRFGGQAVAPSAVKDKLRDCDLVISSTNAPHFTLRRELVQEALAGRERGSLIIIDLAVPRDVEPSVGELPGVRLYDIDDLEGLAGIAPRPMEAEMAEARAIVEEETTGFQRWLASLEVTPIIVAMNKRAESIRVGELAKAFARLKGLSEQEKEIVAAASQAIVNKLLHRPTVNLKALAAAGQGQTYAQAASTIFGLEKDSSAEEDDKGDKVGERDRDGEK